MDSFAAENLRQISRESVEAEIKHLRARVAELEAERDRLKAIVPAAFLEGYTANRIDYNRSMIGAKAAWETSESRTAWEEA